MTARCWTPSAGGGALLVTVALVAGCTGDDDDEGAARHDGRPDHADDTDDRRPTHRRPRADPARLRRDRARPRAQAPSAVTPAAAIVAGAPLDDAAVAAVLARLDPFTGDEAATAPFAWPTETITRPDR